MRHELKYVISPVQYYMLRSRLIPFMQRDSYAGADGNYFIRSIYFDSLEKRALEEKEAGISNRKKYRIRFYNNNIERIALECKSKRGSRIEKSSVLLNHKEVNRLLKQDTFGREAMQEGLLGELELLMRNEGFQPVVVVDYLREAYVYPASNVRITFDKEVAAGGVTDCLSKVRCLPNILPMEHMILEVKYDAYIPEHISALIASVRPVQVAASKYTMCMTHKMEGRILG